MSAAKRALSSGTSGGRRWIERGWSGALRAAVEGEGIDLVCDRRAAVLHREERLITGVTVRRPDDGAETIGCDRLILACNGFGGNRELVARHMPRIESALWFGHDGNRGEAITWGGALGAATRHLGAYQGHGNVAHPHGILITWATITAGGIQVNADGKRFHDESQGYSEAARAVLAQPGGTAVTVFDERIAAIARQFEDYRLAEARGAVVAAADCAELAAAMSLPGEAMSEALGSVPMAGRDAFGRDWPAARPLAPPYCAVRVTGALFHTQGGLQTDGEGRVQSLDGAVLPNLLAAGGAACGVSGSSDAGYLSGNGLLSAIVLGRAAGAAA